MPSPFPCSFVIHQCSWKKFQIEKKKREVKPIRNKKQSAGSNFKLAKTPQNTWGGLSSIPQNYTKMKKISKG